MAAKKKETAEPSAAESAQQWFDQQVPDDWFDGQVEVRMDRDEILVIGNLSCPDGHDDTEAPEGQQTLLEQEEIQTFRERTRGRRVEVARRGEALFERKVSWGARCGGTGLGFTTLSTPVMTRLRIDERQVLDTLVAGGVARSRSDALAWCVRLVAEHEADWIDELRTALDAVNKVRARRPD